AITNSYSAGNVSGNSNVGGLVGDKPGYVVNSFWDIQRSRQPTSASGIGKTTAQMMMTDTFLHWGACGQVWTINEGVDYPRLTWQQIPGEPVVGIIPFEGDGVLNNPYLIHTAQELNAIRLFPCVWDKHFKLMADIDLSQYTGTDFNIIVHFSGTFDGNGHTISNFTYISNDTGYIGLFGDVFGEIKNLGLIDPNLDAESERYVGLLAGFLDNGTITNCYVEGGSVSGHVHVGILVGFNNDGTISECYSTGSISGALCVGGLVGRNDIGIISKSYSIASVSGERILGGLAGENKDTITNCYAMGSVSGNRELGGLVGYNWKATITNCYATASVSGIEYDVGALVGYDREGSYTKSFWDKTVNPLLTGIGSGVNPDVIGESTANMQKESTFTDAGWDFGNVWWILEGAGYPRFYWEDKYGGGSGCPNDPYLIYTAEQMNTIDADSNDLDKHFLLCADIDLSGYTGTQFNIIGTDIYNPFTGVFDGNGHKISNFTWSSTDYGNHIGLFTFLGIGGHIKDLVMEEVNINAAGSYYVGSLVGANNGGTIQDCYASGSVTASHKVGGLAGHNRKSESTQGTIKGCHSATNVSGHRSVGGLAGGNYYGVITDCNSTGTITGERYVGGLVGKLDGHNGSGTIRACSSTATVSGKHDTGGLVGRNDGLITDCYATGSVTGWWATGGLVGGNIRYNTISDCYSTATVSGSWFTGGLVGSNGGKITNCYSASSVYGASRYLAGLVGFNGDSITACYSTGPVSGTADLSGGLVGENERGTISNCYSTSGVNANDYVGGLVGNNPDGIIINSYCTGEVTGNLYVGGLLGGGGGTVNCFWDTENSGQSSSNGGTGKTTAEMKTAGTFFGWNGCGEIFWNIDEENDYPRLLWEGAPGQPLPEQQISDFLEGNGTPDEPYLIDTADQLNMIGLFVCEWDKHFLLVNDIDLSQHSGIQFNLIGNPCHSFAGVFDGDHHKIQNFSWTSEERDYIGLFRNLDEAGQIKNLTMENVDVNATNGDSVGGLVGMSEGSIISCYAKGSVFGYQSVGGLVGYNTNSIVDCYTSGNVSGGNDSGFVGGLCGKSTGPDHGQGQSSIKNCYSTATVTGYALAGGLIGHSGGVVTGCYSTGCVNDSVNGSGGSLGGLIGSNGGYGSISNCYSTASVTVDQDLGVGGLVGYNKGTISASFWDIQTSGFDWSDGGTGLPTAEMQMAGTFTEAGWDFVGETFNGIEDIWFIPQQDYPHLWWEGMGVSMKLTPRTLNCRSQGNWVKANLILPEGFTVADVDPDRPAVLHSFGFQSAPLYVFVNKDKLVQIEAAFERQALCSLAGNWPQALTVAGFLADGNIFLGSSKVRITHPGMNVIEELASYWLQTDCVHPDFCNGIDMNRDSIVNLLDYALLMNTNVEFINE
ncbi:MAG: GLUG motif-containing protein, partial [Planctomycetota bacterium]